MEEASGLTIQKLHGEGQEAIEGIIQHLADHPVRLDVQGQVRSGDGTPLIGAVVREKGTPNGTLTDENGRFRLSVASDKAVLVISYFGYITQEVAVAGQPSFDIVMLPSETSLEEVVVIGYGQVKKKDLIGSVDQINSEKIENLPVTSFDLALAGQAAGVQFRQGTGQPGAGAEILIRGVGSISAGNQPLIVIDGLPFGNYNGQTDNLLALLDPNDIESISIVRDASGKAIYGSRAANGLILITTKRGTTDQKPTIEFNSYVGLQTILDFERPNVLRADELAQFLRERIEDQAVVNGTTPTIPAHLEDPSSYGAGTDWFDAITRDAWMHNVNLNLRGGTKDLRYAIGMGFMNQDGVIIETNLKRYSLRANIDADITPWLRLNLEVAPSWTSNASGNTDPGGGQFSVYNVVNIAQWADPSAPLYDDNGELTPTTQGALLPFFQANPVYKLRNQINQRDNRQLLLGATLGATLAPGLELKTYLGTNVLNNASRAFSPGSVVGQGLTPFNPDPPANSNARAGRYESLRLVSTTTLGYQRSLAGGKHQIDAILGQSAEYQQETFFNAGGSRLIDENFTYFTSGNIAVNLPSNPDETRIFFSAGEGRSEQALLSYFGRLSYTFANRYILTATVRTDGSSRFGPNNRYATFPSAGLAWRVSEEPWFPKTNLLTNLRLEGSWGRSGNNRIGNYAWQGLVSTSGDYVLGGGRVEGA
ncbi:MAG: SusC/RagA family TonB-linked outer membrane protein, partial [Bacteroidetes bacterium]